LSSGTWGIMLVIKTVALLSASLRVRSAFSCNVSPVVAASGVIVGADFVPSSGEGIVGCGMIYCESSALTSELSCE
jgi:hypothetical protein